MTGFTSGEQSSATAILGEAGMPEERELAASGRVDGQILRGSVSTWPK